MVYCDSCKCFVTRFKTHIKNEKHKFHSTYDKTGFEEVKEISGYYIHQDGRVFYNEGLLTLFVITKSGFVSIRIKGKIYLLHRLLAIQFLANPNNLSIVEHIDGDKTNNSLENLRWEYRDYCVFCDLYFSNLNDFTQHKKSDKHKFHSTYDKTGFEEIKGNSGYYIHPDGRIIGKISLLTHSINNMGYEYVRMGRDNAMLVHRIIAIQFIPNPLNLPNVDHIDRNPLNNSVENLRWCNQSQNMANMSLSKSNTSGFKGVRLSHNKWKAHIYIDGKSFYSPLFKDIQDAVAWRKEQEEKHPDSVFYLN